MARGIDDYCTIAGISLGDEIKESCFFAQDGSMCTLLRLEGTRSYFSEDEMREKLIDFADNIASSFRSSGHALTITFEQSGNTKEEIDAALKPLHENASRKRLNNEGALEEISEILEKNTTRERVLLAIWTFKEVASKQQYRDELAKRRDELGRLPIDKYVQSWSGAWRSIASEHFSVVSGMISQLGFLGIHARILGKTDTGGREDMTEIRRGLLFHETYPDWSPRLDIRYPPTGGIRNDSDRIFAPPISKQVLASSAKASGDFRTVSLGGRHYALAHINLMPNEIDSFNSLLREIRGNSSLSTIPFRIAFHIEGGASVNGFKSFLATVGATLSQNNRNISRALDGLGQLMNKAQETFVTFRVYATTWVEPNESLEVLSDRRSLLVRAISAWRKPNVADSAIDPMKMLSETVAGMTGTPRAATGFIAPIREVALAFPFHTNAPVEKYGETMFVTLDGKPSPYKTHSTLQTAWLSLFVAPSGGGKSVMLNGMNIDFASYYNSTRLPYIGAIDIGVSSAGFIQTVENALPADRRSEVKYFKLKNNMKATECFVNPFDIGLGRRSPLGYETEFIQNFLAILFGLPVGATSNNLIQTVIAKMYQKMSDISINGEPKIWQPDRDKEVDEAIRRLGFEVNEKNTTWWKITDQLIKANEPELAERAQRNAMPVLADIITILSDSKLQDQFGDTAKNVRTTLQTSLNQYPIFANPTQMDIGEARIVSIDLDEVVVKNATNENVTRSNTLMFMIARQLFVKKISGHPDDVAMMQFSKDPEATKAYANFWRKRLEQVATTHKRFCIDEYHVTGNNPVMAGQIDQDVRHGRKWGMEIFLASQRVGDFEALKDMATNIFVLKSDSAEDRKKISTIFGLTSAQTDAIKRYVHGARPEGAKFLLGRKTVDGESWNILVNQIGARRKWALSTTLEDMQVRNILYDMMGVPATLELLSNRFPDGTLRNYWNRFATSITDDNESIARQIANELWKSAS